MVHLTLQPKMKKLLKKETDQAPSVSFLSLYQFSTRWEKFLLVIGFLACSISGFGHAVNAINFCELADAMIAFHNLNETTEADEDDFKEAVFSFFIIDTLVVVSYLVFRYLSLVTFNYAACNQVLRMRGLLFKSMMNWDTSWYDQNRGGELPSRLNEDLSRIEDGIGEKVPIYMTFVMAFIFSLIISFVIGWEYAVHSLVPSLIVLAILIYVSSGTAKLAKQALAANAEAGAVAEEVFGAIRTVQAFDGKEKEIERYTQKIEMAEKVSKKREIYSSLFNGMQWGLFSISNGYGAWYGIRLILKQRHWDPDDIVYTPKTMLMIYYGLSLAISHLSLSGMFVESFAIAKGAGAKVLHLIKQGSKINPLANTGLRPADCMGNVSFQKINFHYPTRPDVQILKDFSLNIRSGEVVAIVGHSGSGKSTCIQLLQRLYDANEGSIMLDGIDIKTLNVNWLREHIGVVGQEPVLFGTTIYENIRYGRLDATQKQIEEVSRIANAHDFIMKLPQGYNTQVGERGAQLSGGQKQRIAIARALIRNPDILLLDEATSALDVKNEAKVQVALERASQGRTTIIVAHRLSTIRNAHKIVVLDRGQVVEMGSHNELMVKHGAYYSMVTNQVNSDMESVNSTQSPLIITDLAENGDEVDDDNIVVQQKQDELKVVNDDSANLKPATSLQIMKLHPKGWPLMLIGSVFALIGGMTIPLYCFVFGAFIGSLADQSDEELRNNSEKFGYAWIAVGSTTGISIFLQSYLMGLAGESLTKNVRKKCFKTMISQDIGWFDDKKNGTGMLCSRLSGDTSDLHQATGSRIGNSLTAIGMTIAALTLSLVYKWQMAIIALAFLPVTYFFMWAEKKTRHREILVKSKALGLSSKLVVEVISNMRTVISLGRQELFYEKYMEILEPAAKRQKFNIHLRGICYALTSSLSTILFIPLIIYGCYLILEGEFEFGDAIITARAWASTAIMISNRIAYTPNVQRGLVAAARILQMLSRQPEIMDTDQIYRNTKHESRGNVKFESVEFSYPTAPETKILRDLNLDVRQGQNIALVGPSGCGKSTCIQLLQRFYDVTRGQVGIDEQDIRSFPLRNLRLQLGIVSQEASLFNRTVAENIAYGDNTRQVPVHEVIEAAKNSNIHNFIISLPEGYETKVGDKGTQLSGGQKQRIAIARALIRNPKILLLDEATSALDIESEKVVQAALDIAKKGRTCITIAHRLATIMDADVIYVMKDGRIVESGSHRELLRMRGIYFGLYKSQRYRRP